MFCKKCGMRIRQGVDSCPHCGAPAELAEYCGGFWGLTGSAAGETAGAQAEEMQDAAESPAVGGGQEEPSAGRMGGFRQIAASENDQESYREEEISSREKRRRQRDQQKIRLLSITAGTAAIIAIAAMGGCISNQRQIKVQDGELAGTNIELSEQNTALVQEKNKLAQQVEKLQAQLDQAKASEAEESAGILHSEAKMESENEPEDAAAAADKEDLEKELEELKSGEVLIGTILYNPDVNNQWADYARDENGDPVVFYSYYDGNLTKERFYDISYESYGTYDAEGNPISVYKPDRSLLFENPETTPEAENAEGTSGDIPPSGDGAPDQEGMTDLTDTGMNESQMAEGSGDGGLIVDDGTASASSADTSTTEGGLNNNPMAPSHNSNPNYNGGLMPRSGNGY